MPYVFPNRKGSYPEGYPRFFGAGITTSGYDASELEKATDDPNIELYKAAINDVWGETQSYFNRCDNARDWWYARWPNQCIDGRKWGDVNQEIEPWPWPGASDTRMRTCEKIIGQHRTLGTFALRNMKVQAKSTKPAATMRESQQATALLNWMLFSHMQAELHLESRLAMSWRNGYGASIIKNGWKQTRMMDYIDVNVMGLQEFINEPAVVQFIGGNSKIPIGENLNILDLQEMILDPAYADSLSELLKAVSHDFLTLRESRKKLEDLRAFRTVEVPIPYVFESRPFIAALRPMVDVIFPWQTDNFQTASFIDEVEMVSETTLRDRIHTDKYDPKFVDKAIQRRGPTTNSIWLDRTQYERNTITGIANPMLNDIELHHFFSLVHDRGVPARFCTVMHMDVDIPAKHYPTGYDHGQACFHTMRFEIEERAILSSQGIAEKAYTWEQELKTQYDAQVDRTAIDIRPIMLTTYDQLEKWKSQMMPGAVIPTRKFDESQWMKPPPWSQVSIMIVQQVELRIREHFGIFGNDLDPQLKKLRQEEFVDDILLEWKPIIQQMRKNMAQLLPEEDSLGVVGINRFHMTRDQLQNEYDITATVDLRNIDSEWMKEKISLASQIIPMDTIGVTDKNFVIRSLWEAVDYTYADMAVRDQEPVTDKEIQDEQKAIDLIIGSGQDQPIPKDVNYQLRIQTAMAKVQSIPQNPATMKIVQANPQVMEVIANRIKSFQFELQQQENAQIGRMGVTETFSKQAPQLEAKSPMLAGY